MATRSPLPIVTVASVGEDAPIVWNVSWTMLPLVSASPPPQIIIALARRPPSVA